MADYRLYATTQFNPFSFERYVQPLTLYRASYKEAEDKYNDLAEDSAQWGDQLTPGSKAYQMWDTFQKDITDAASDLATNGLSPATRAKMTEVRKSYGKNIKAIASANEEYKKAQAMRDQIQGNDDTVRYRKNISIDDFLHGGKGSTEHLSGTKLRTETADMAEKLGTAIFSNPEFSKAMGNYYYQIGIAKGAPAAMLQYIQDGNLESIPHGENATEGQKKLYNNMKSFATLYNQQIDRTKGYSDIDRSELNNQIFQGMYAGLAKPAYDYQRNLGVMTASEAAADRRAKESLAEQKREFDEKMAWEKDANNPSNIIANGKKNGTSSSSSSADYSPNDRFIINADGETTSVTNTEDRDLSKMSMRVTSLNYDSLPTNVKEQIKITLGINGKDVKDDQVKYYIDNYHHYIYANPNAKKDSWYSPGDWSDDMLYFTPKIKKTSGSSETNTSSSADSSYNVNG